MTGPLPPVPSHGLSRVGETEPDCKFPHSIVIVADEAIVYVLLGRVDRKVPGDDLKALWEWGER